MAAETGKHKGRRRVIPLLTLILTLALSTLTSGCWNRRELNRIGIVSAVGLDLGPDHKIELTVQIIRARAMKMAEGASGEGKAVWVVSSSGDTVFDAVRNLVEKSGRRLYYPHNSLIVLGQELAREGVRPVMDLFARDQEMRLLAWVVVAQGTAADVLKADSELNNVPSKQLEDMLKNYNIVSKSVGSNLLEFDDSLLSKTTQPVLGRVVLDKVSGKNELRLDGAGVFRGDKLIGWLDSTETRGYLFIKDKVKSGSVLVPSPGNPDQAVTLEIIRAGSRVKPEWLGGKARFEIDVKVEANLVEQASAQKLSSPDMISVLEEELNQAIANQMRTTISAAQTHYKADIFGFGTDLMRAYPEEWQGLAGKWEAEFPLAETQVKVQSKITHTDLSQ
ncbi:germination protein, Ger(x)C family [Acididesulfobacillus acetoxydans]|uniref:Germination protein, Ger(X)C family n=1 Tax=Acididesulfobacillus acetoxydans TaxID=1561005 RepID=A0A8S0VVJ7_9FIRM|nr:Ger(x)C family spore germination protein [Acididesulfobacillus acetoxydans]CAA7599663.1 germination protein, Ger(x)C family [Acididesulfobacillus acetoxydans]CEJ06215.1 Spore germination protein KC [Acididesulfobacillus acetoxydans]